MVVPVFGLAVAVLGRHTSRWWTVGGVALSLGVLLPAASWFALEPPTSFMSERRLRGEQVLVICRAPWLQTVDRSAGSYTDEDFERLEYHQGRCIDDARPRMLSAVGLAATAALFPVLGVVLDRSRRRRTPPTPQLRVLVAETHQE